MWNVQDPSRWDAYCKGWYGWGELAARWWILGIEPGIDKKEVANQPIQDALERRGAVWSQLGSGPTVDFARFHEGIENDRWSRALQQTWRKCLRVREVSLGNEPTRDRLLHAQSLDKDVAYIDFWPLPNRSVREWCGSCLENRPRYLATREDYEKELRDHRFRWMDRELAKRSAGTVTIAAGAALLAEMRQLESWETAHSLKDGVDGRERFRLLRLPGGGLLLHMSQGRGLPNRYLDVLGNLVRKYK
jgi:hypothetical protein